MFGKFKDYSPKDMKKLFFRKLKKPFYTGSSFQCPVCNTNLKKFNPIWKSFSRTLNDAGFIYKTDDFETFNQYQYSCPSCDASDRERLYALYIQKWLSGLDKNKVTTFIDFAPAMAISAWLRSIPHINYTSADLYRPNVDIKVDITNMPELKSGSIDAFLCSHILEHVVDDMAALKELKRILKPSGGGWGIVMVPLIKGVSKTQEDPAFNTEQLRIKYYSQGDHLRQYGTEDFLIRIKEAGFTVDSLDINWFGEAAFKKAGISPNSKLYIVKNI